MNKTKRRRQAKTNRFGEIIERAEIVQAGEEWLREKSHFSACCPKQRYCFLVLLEGYS